MKSDFEIIKSENVTMATRQAQFMQAALKQIMSVASQSVFTPKKICYKLSVVGGIDMGEFEGGS